MHCNSMLEFKQYIRNAGGVWASDDVVFAVVDGHFAAAYLPQYPNTSNRDSSIFYDYRPPTWVGRWSGRGPLAVEGLVRILQEQ